MKYGPDVIKPDSFYVSGNKSIIGKVGAVVVSAAILSFVVLLLLFNLDSNALTNTSETFQVSDPDVDRTCSLGFIAQTDGLVVQYYNGSAMKTLTASDYVFTGSQVIVSASAMT